MRQPSRPSILMKTAQAAALAIFVCFCLGATDAGSRFNDLGHRLMCTCGCNQMLGECNHVGCPDSPGELAELRTAIARTSSDDEILAGFAQKYGATMLAAPTTHGFDLVAWIAPFAVFAAALAGTILLVKRWSTGKTQGQALTESAHADPADHARMEEIRRETDTAGGGGD